MNADPAVLNRPVDQERSLADRFLAFADQWKRETLVLSNPTAIESHPAYQEIVQMGADAIPLILKELAKEPDW
jgi:hypothetical protein